MLANFLPPMQPQGTHDTHTLECSTCPMASFSNLGSGPLGSQANSTWSEMGWDRLDPKRFPSGLVLH